MCGRGHLHTNNSSAENQGLRGLRPLLNSAAMRNDIFTATYSLGSIPPESPCRTRKTRPPRICRRGEPVRQILIDWRTNARVDDKSRRPHFCVCRRHLRENNRMHTASIGTARATLPAGSYLQPAFSAAHLRLVSPTAREKHLIEYRLE